MTQVRYVSEYKRTIGLGKLQTVSGEMQKSDSQTGCTQGKARRIGIFEHEKME